MFEDHAFEEGFDDALFFFREAGDGLELELEIVRGSAFRFIEQQLVGGAAFIGWYIGLGIQRYDNCQPPRKQLLRASKCATENQY